MPSESDSCSNPNASLSKNVNLMPWSREKTLDAISKLHYPQTPRNSNNISIILQELYICFVREVMSHFERFLVYGFSAPFQLKKGGALTT